MLDYRDTPIIANEQHVNLKGGHTMLKSEWHYLFQHKMMIIVLIAIALIPAIYCFIYLSSMWDTYGKMDDLPVAIVNHDQTATYHGKSISIGTGLTRSLTESKSLDFHHVTAKTAADRLRQGKYYMILTVPKDFSKKATTILTAKPQAMNLYFRFNSGQNFIVSKMTTGVATAIKAKVSQQVTKLDATVVLNTLHQATKGTAKAASGSQALAVGAQKLTANNTTITKELQAITNGSQQLQQGNQTLADSLNTAVQKLSIIHTKTRNASALAAPVHEVTSDIAKIPNNGTGMAPFAIAIGLYVGGIALGTMYEGFLPHKKPRNALTWWASKASVIGSVGLLQAVLLNWSLTAGNHLHVADQGAFFGTILLGSLLFLSLIFCLRLLLGGFGTWLVSIVLVLQLAGSGGLYPTYLVNNFAKAINAWLPMTYLIDALRSLISTHQAITTNIWVIIVLIFGFNIAMIVRFQIGLHQSFIEIETNAEEN